MEWLKANAAVVGLPQLIGSNWPESPSGLVCAVTFDDGYASVFRQAYPVLRELQFPAAVYLVTGAISDSKPKSSNDFAGLYPDEDMLTWEQVSEMHTFGIQFGSHLVWHRQLTALTPVEADKELRVSKQTIEDRLNQECESFCYPWGGHDDRSVAAVRRAGYRNAVVTIQDRWLMGACPDPYRIPRADIRREYTLQDFAAVVRGDWDYLGYIQRLRRWTE